jgi:hypothetical protein
VPKRYYPVVNFSKKDHFKGKHEKDRIPKDYVLIFSNASGTKFSFCVNDIKSNESKFKILRLFRGDV